MTAEKQHNHWWLGGIVAFSLIYAWLVFAAVGSEDFFDLHTDALPAIFALGGWVVVISMVRLGQNTKIERAWRLLAWGISFWLMADVIWVYEYYFLPIATDMPALSDVFWAAGYVPVILGFWWQYRALNVRLSISRRAFLAAVFTGVFILGAFVFHPLYISGRMGLSAKLWLGVWYLVMDMLLVLVLSFLFMAVRGGRLAVAWRWVIAGFALLAFADVLFALLLGHEMYYAPGKNQFWSLFADYIYVQSYFLIFVGLVRYRQIYVSAYQVKPLALAREETGPLQIQNRIVIFTDPEDRIISATPVLADLLGLQTTAEVEGQPLRDVLPGLAKMEERLHEERFINEMLVTLQAADGRSVPARVSALGSYDRYGQWMGGNILLGLLVSLGVEDRLNAEFQNMAHYIAEQTGLLQQEEEQVAREYLNRLLLAFRAAILERKGEMVADSFVRNLVAQLRQQGYPVELKEDGQVSLMGKLSTDEYWHGVMLALEHINTSAADLIGHGATRDVFRQVNASCHQGRMKEILLERGLLQE